MPALPSPAFGLSAKGVGADGAPFGSDFRVKDEAPGVDVGGADALSTAVVVLVVLVVVPSLRVAPGEPKPEADCVSAPGFGVACLLIENENGDAFVLAPAPVPPDV